MSFALQAMAAANMAGGRIKLQDGRRALMLECIDEPGPPR